MNCLRYVCVALFLVGASQHTAFARTTLTDDELHGLSGGLCYTGDCAPGPGGLAGQTCNTFNDGCIDKYTGATKPAGTVCNACPTETPTMCDRTPDPLDLDGCAETNEPCQVGKAGTCGFGTCTPGIANGTCGGSWLLCDD